MSVVHISVGGHAEYPSPGTTQKHNLDTDKAKSSPVDCTDQLPDDSDDAKLSELSFARMIVSGLEDADAGRTTSHEQVRKEIEPWTK